MYGISVCQKRFLLNNSEQFPAGRRATGQECKPPNITDCHGLACIWPDCDEGLTKDFLNAQLHKKTRTLATSYGKAKVALLLLHFESDTLRTACHLLTTRCTNLILKSWGLPSLWQSRRKATSVKSLDLKYEGLNYEWLAKVNKTNEKHLAGSYPELRIWSSVKRHNASKIAHCP